MFICGTWCTTNAQIKPLGLRREGARLVHPYVTGILDRQVVRRALRHGAASPCFLDETTETIWLGLDSLNGFSHVHMAVIAGFLFPPGAAIPESWHRRDPYSMGAALVNKGEHTVSISFLLILARVTARCSVCCWVFLLQASGGRRVPLGSSPSTRQVR